jgi:hypothetical protein
MLAAWLGETPMVRVAVVPALVAAFAVLTPVSASAQDFMNMQMPSHNIYCQAEAPGIDGPNPSLRCDIMHKTTRDPPAPRNCPLSYGDSYGLNPTGTGYLVCHGDTVQNSSAVVVPYGQQWRAYGFTCTSQTTGVTCVNGQGHGFSMAQAAQKAF